MKYLSIDELSDVKVHLISYVRTFRDEYSGVEFPFTTLKFVVYIFDFCKIVVNCFPNISVLFCFMKSLHDNWCIVSECIDRLYLLFRSRLQRAW